MPGKIKVKVLAGRNLPVMDRASETTDAFVEIKFGSVTHKTDVCRKSLNPHWSSTEWYRFEVDESELQDEPLQLRLMDHDTYSANDAIGKVVISLAPLLAREADIVKGHGGPPGGAVLSGWIPVFDTMHGIRGELNVIVKIELFSDFNKYKTSSCGVQFFHCPLIPPGYKATAVHGFVEELVVNDDPEYQWIDKIRTPRASNEARQVAFIKLSNQVQRLVGLKAAELGANAVVGYQQDFDLEGEAGVVARAIGTAVSIVPPPSPSQPLNIPPCTQQQLKKYLDILATDNESITDLNQYFQNHQDELQKLLNIMNPKTPALLDEQENNEDDEPGTLSTLTRQSSIKSYTGSLSIYQDDYVSQKSLKHISEDQTDLNKLLKKNEDSDSDGSGPIQKIKKMKTNFFFRRFGSMRPRKSDKQEKQEDQISLQSNSSDNSRMSLTDIKNEIKRFKHLKKPKFRKAFTNKQDEGVGMASILARSVIHAHTSLACIAETQDSEPSPSSTMRRTSESEPTINISDEDDSKTVEIKADNLNLVQSEKLKVPEIHTSLNNLSTEEANNKNLQRKLSESCPATPLTERSGNLLKLPGETGYFGSLSLSGDSSEVYSSSDEDYESSDQKTDTEKSIETTSSVVQSVLNNGVNKALIANMDRKLSILQAPVPDFKESKSQGTINDGTQYNPFESSKSSPCIHEDTNNDSLEIMKDSVKVELSKESNNKELETPEISNSNKTLHFKFHNPFSHKKVSKSVSAPSSPIENKGFMYRSSKRIRHQLSKLSNSNMMKSISHYSLMPKKKQKPVKIALSQPGSTSDVPSMSPSHETVLGSPFLSFADLKSLDQEGINLFEKPLPISDDLEQFRVKMYIGSEPVSRASLSGLSASYKGDSHFDSKHMKITKTPHKKSSLVHTAVETILIDKVQSLLVPTPEPGNSKERQFFYDVNQKLEKVEEARNQLNQCKNDWEFGAPHMKTPRKISKNESLFNTAMETILMDKVQALLTPTTPEPHQLKDSPFFPHSIQKDDNLKNKDIHMEKSQPKENTKDHSSLIDTAMKTILMDKVQSLIPPTSETLIIEEDQRPDVTDVPKRNNEQEDVTKDVKKHDSIIHTAMETILLDKVQTLILPGSDNTSLKTQNRKGSDQEPELLKVTETKYEGHPKDTETREKEQTKRETSKNDEQTLEKSDLSKQNLVHTAMETILIDKLQAIIPSAAETIAPENGTQTGSIFETNTQKLDVQGEATIEDNKINSMLQTALQTILIDKVQSLLSSESADMDSNVTDERSKNKKIIANSSTNNDKNETTLEFQKCDTDNPDSSHKMSKEIFANISVPCKMSHSKPVLQHFHPILSGTPLEPIPSLPERSLDHTESIDIEGVERTCDCPSECQWQACVSETNSASVCDNSHAACRFDRNDRDKEKFEKDKGSPRHARHESYGGREPVATSMSAQNPSLNSSSAPLGMHRRSSDSDLSVTPKGSSLSASVGNAGSGGGAILRPSMNTNTLEMLEYPFLTMNEYPPGFIINIGGTVCARSVKLVDAGGESAARAAWWAELRTELRAHARALRCNAVIAYSESAAICEDVCVLSASGTAVSINLECDFNFNQPDSAATSASNGNGCNGTEEEEPEFCSIAHVPYSPGTGPYRVELSTCGGCRRARVPAVLLATCEKPNRLRSYSKAITVTAVAARVRRAPPGAEPGARDISDQLPFLEYELHKLLLAKLRMQGANALFSLQTQIAIGERCVMALASGTAVRLAALPPPTPPRVKASENDKEALEMQKALWDSFTANKTSNGYDIAGSGETAAASSLPDIESEESLAPALDLCADKDTCVLELDESEDVETAKALAVRRTHMQVFSNSLKATPGVAPQAFAQVWRARLTLSAQGGGASTSAERHVQRALDGVTYKLRRLQPCALVAPRFHLELPEDEIQLVVSGTAIPLIDPNKPDNIGDGLSQHSQSPSRSQSPQPSQGISHAHSNSSGHNASHGNSYTNSNSYGNSNGSSSNGTADADDDIFALDEEQVPKASPATEADDKNVIVNGYIPTTVSLTSLSHAAGSRAVRRICALRLLFVRETTAVRELGGLSGFLHTFTCEVLAIVRAYTAALGGNMLMSFYLKQLMLQDNAHKNQGQCLLSVGGDVVQITY